MCYNLLQLQLVLELETEPDYDVYFGYILIISLVAFCKKSCYLKKMHVYTDSACRLTPKGMTSVWVLS